ncbi:MAG: glycosyltransferase family 2 protein [Verrucomicrobiota bacterium]|nr:glycosyltransferase family 2 protein [Verrucomicrobiota bacterium]
MPNSPKISVVTPSFNSIHTIRATIASVARQDYPHVEHIVVDGGSTDGTLEVLRGSKGLSWVSEKDEGHYHAMDKGTRMASGEVVAILNADDCYRPGVLGEVAAAFVKHPDWDGMFGDVVFVDGDGREIFRREEAMFDHQVIRFGHNVVNHQALFLKKAAYLRIGGYRYKDFKNCCDYEFVMRLIRERCRVGHIPVYIVDYRYHEHGQSADLRVRANMARESELIRKEYGLPGGFLGDVLRVYARLKRQAQKLLIRGKCDLIPGGLLLKKHLREKTTFSSNIGVDKL